MQGDKQGRKNRSVIYCPNMEGREPCFRTCVCFRKGTELGERDECDARRHLLDRGVEVGGPCRYPVSEQRVINSETMVWRDK